ncbi:hypothetical protein J6590_105870 [Homalodisca vitripennis]|nr:hypothetical protein J6590_105870 [Homalodisca vitripennis]
MPLKGEVVALHTRTPTLMGAEGWATTIRVPSRAIQCHLNTKPRTLVRSAGTGRVVTQRVCYYGPTGANHPIDINIDILSSKTHQRFVCPALALGDRGRVQVFNAMPLM